VFAAAFSPDGTRVVTASEDGSARVWDAIMGTPVTAPLRHGGAVTAVRFSADGTRVITASEDGSARVWDATHGAQALPTPRVERGRPVAAEPSPSEHDIAARVWSPPALPGPLAHRSAVTAAALSPDGSRVVTASTDHTAQVWDATTGKPVTPPLEHQDVVTAAAFSPDGTRVVTASKDRTARVWDATTGRPVTAPFEHLDAVTAVAFSPDGKRVVTGSADRTARVWDATSGSR
jgi:WD40 repeat protein